MELNYTWEIFTWTKRNGSGIKNVIQGGQLGTCYQNLFVTALIRNITFWVVSLSSRKQV